MSSIEADFREKGVALIDFQGKELADIYKGLSNIGYPVLPFTYEKALEDAKSIDPRVVIFNATSDGPVPVKLFPNKPIITISHNEDRRADVKLLNAGSEIVIPTPVTVDLLDSYIRSTIAREERPKNILPPLKLTDELYIDRSAGRIMRGDTRVKTNPRVVDFLEFVALNKEFSHEEMRSWLKDHGYKAHSENCYALIQLVRSVIDNEGDPSHIQKIRNYGYKFSPTIALEDNI